MHSEWPELTSLLSPINTKKFQHINIFNPIKNRLLNFSPKNHKNSDPFFDKKKPYKLPSLSNYTLNRRENISNRASMATMDGIKEKRMKELDLQNQIGGENQGTGFSKKEQYKGKINYKELRKVYQTCWEHQKKSDNKDSYFSYCKNIEEHILKIVLLNMNGQKTETVSANSSCYESFTRMKEKNEKVEDKSDNLERGRIILKDFLLLLQNIDRKSMVNTIKNLQFFKKKSSYFIFKSPEIRILYHCLLAEISMYHNNLEKVNEELQFAEYHCRKNNLEFLAIYFLWEISNSNMFAQKNEEATASLKNLLEMAVVVGNRKKAIKYAFQRLSLIFYYRGNALIGEYYMKKSEEGLTSFEEQIYLREYSKSDELKRLQSILFNQEHGQKVIKRKNNPKFEEDILKISLEDFEKKHVDYIESVNSMLKSFENCKDGIAIKKIIKQNENIGELKIENCSKSSQTSHLLGKENFKLKSLCETQIDNTTRILKSHLSMNRQNFTMNRESRWKKFIHFLFFLEEKLTNLIEERDRNIQSST